MSKRACLGQPQDKWSLHLPIKSSVPIEALKGFSQYTVQLFSISRLDPSGTFWEQRKHVEAKDKGGARSL